jgi:alpha-beta hydrolase superfamily lysophospholipase
MAAMATTAPVDGGDEGLINEVRARDGYRLKYRTWSSGSAEPRRALVLLNGVMSHSLWFHPLAAPLVTAGFKLIGADRRGTGMNTAARGDVPSASALIDDALAVIDRERLPGRPLHLAGWCWGAVLAINVAAAMADRLTSLVLLAPGLFPTALLAARMAAQEGAPGSGVADQPCLVSPISEEMFTTGPALGFIRSDEHRLARFTPRFREVMGKMAMGARLKLPGLSLPILLVLARHDLATDNEETERRVTALTGGRAVVQQVNSAHGIQFDAPDELARSLTAWADQPARG